MTTDPPSLPQLNRLGIARLDCVDLLRGLVIALMVLGQLFAQVIYAIGVGMMMLGLLIWLPRNAVLALGVLIVAGHNALAPIDAAALGAATPLWTFAFELGPMPGVPGFVAYPFVPWLGVMCLGYGLGAMFLLPKRQRRRSVLILGASALAALLVLRAINAYGNQSPWREYETAGRTVLSFFNVSKYPPSLLYL